MYDIKPLEEDWKKYEFNKRKPFYLFISLFVLILVITYYLFYNTTNETKVFDKLYQNITTFSKSKSEQTPNISKHTLLVNGSLNKLEVLDETNIIPNVTGDISTDKLLVDIPILEISDSASIEKKETTKKRKVYIDIFETTSVTAYEDVERRFKQSGDIDDALFLAKSYYKKGNFKKSEYWAFETNKLDSSLEESFLIFVKSKSKLGKVNEAISILNTYLKQTNSQEAKVLLEELKNNKF